MIAAPASAPAIVPRPPESATPPITQATIEVELVALPDPVVDEPDIAAQDQPGDRGEAARDHVAGDRDQVGVDADQRAGDRIAADDIDPAAEGGSRQEDPEQRSATTARIMKL